MCSAALTEAGHESIVWEGNLDNKLHQQVIAIDDVQYVVGPCKHCQGIATEGDVLKAISEWKEANPGLSKCAHCGSRITIKSATIAHSFSLWRKDPIWSVTAFTIDNGMALRIHDYEDVFLHEDCGRKALSHLDWEVGERLKGLMEA